MVVLGTTVLEGLVTDGTREDIGAQSMFQGFMVLQTPLGLQLFAALLTNEPLRLLFELQGFRPKVISAQPTDRVLLFFCLLVQV